MVTTLERCVEEKPDPYAARYVLSAAHFTDPKGSEYFPKNSLDSTRLREDLVASDIILSEAVAHWGGWNGTNWRIFFNDLEKHCKRWEEDRRNHKGIIPEQYRLGDDESGICVCTFLVRPPNWQRQAVDGTDIQPHGSGILQAEEYLLRVRSRIEFRSLLMRDYVKEKIAPGILCGTVKQVFSDVRTQIHSALTETVQFGFSVYQEPYGESDPAPPYVYIRVASAKTYLRAQQVVLPALKAFFDNTPVHDAMYTLDAIKSIRMPSLASKASPHIHAAVEACRNSMRDQSTELNTRTYRHAIECAAEDFLQNRDFVEALTYL